MTTPVASQTGPSHTPSVSGLSLSPQCPQVWTKDVDNIGDNSYRRVRFERSAHLSPSVDHLWMVSSEPPKGKTASVDENALTGDEHPVFFPYPQTTGPHPLARPQPIPNATSLVHGEISRCAQNPHPR